MVQGLTAMKPRQVLLSSSAKTSSNGKPLSLTAEQKPLLLQAICHFLESSGFSKTLKKFLSEASIERDSWKTCLLNLEDACCIYLDARSQNDADEINISSDKKSEKIVDDDVNIKSKETKKKSGKDSSTQNGEVHRAVESEVALSSDNQEKPSKEAKDKKKKKGSEPSAEPLTEHLQASCVDNGNKGSAEPEKMKSKSERKKNKGTKIDVEDKVLEVDERSRKVTEQDKKSSKKRKKSSSEKSKNDDLVAASEGGSKRRKTAASGDEDTDEQATMVPADHGMQLENDQVGLQTPCSTNGKHSKMLPGDNGEDKSALIKSSAKKQNGSTEPRVQSAFQRVKAEEVEFADEKLQDNSYWAKDGAEIGYGAKAEEVLGQVRGRDFRHEKTKKKRGSYRGGQIDLHSHSVKFNYSDEDE